MKVAEPEMRAAEAETGVAEPETKVAEPETRVAEPETKVAEPETGVAEPEMKVTEPETGLRDERGETESRAQFWEGWRGSCRAPRTEDSGAGAGSGLHEQSRGGQATSLYVRARLRGRHIHLAVQRSFSR
jgi:hypothetical protein